VDFHVGRCIYNLLGIEHAKGVRWSDLKNAIGKLEDTQLDESLVKFNDVSILSNGLENPMPPDKNMARGVLESIQNTHDIVFLDLPRDMIDCAEITRFVDLFIITTTRDLDGVTSSYLIKKILTETNNSRKCLLVSYFSKESSSSGFLPLPKIKSFLGIDDIVDISYEKKIAKRLYTEAGISFEKDSSYRRGIDSTLKVIGAECL
jgi:hypothetical protein